MRKYLIAAFGVLLASTAARAADIVNYQPEPAEPAAAPAPAFSWTGFYAGGEIGGSWGNTKGRLRNGKTTLFDKKIKPDGFIGGILAGYNFQLDNNIVLGADTDFLWDDVSKSKQFGDNKITVKQKWNGATRLRAGYAFDRFLPYLAGGVSYADIEGRAMDKSGNRASKTKTRAGWNVGAGVDYIPPIMNDHIVLRAEYRYTDFGDKTFKSGDDKFRVKYNQNDFRVGIAYKF